MSDELRAAAERLQSHVDECDLANGFWMIGTDIDIIMALTRTYLAEHPVDDAEPVTEEWLRSVGAKDETSGTKDGEPFFDLYIGPARWCYFSSGGTLLIDHHHGWEIKTRGDVRLLCAALGIELKEKK